MTMIEEFFKSLPKPPAIPDETYTRLGQLLTNDAFRTMAIHIFGSMCHPYPVHVYDAGKILILLPTDTRVDNLEHFLKRCREDRDFDRLSQGFEFQAINMTVSLPHPILESEEEELGRLRVVVRELLGERAATLTSLASVVEQLAKLTHESAVPSTSTRDYRTAANYIAVAHKNLPPHP